MRWTVEMTLRREDETEYEDECQFEDKERAEKYIALVARVATLNRELITRTYLYPPEQLDD